MPKASKKLLDALNEDLSYELAALTQYIWHHVMGRGLEFPAISDMFKKLSIEEMKHAVALAERIDLLGGVPTTQPKAIKSGGALKKMLQDDLGGELVAIDLYTQHIALSDKEKDIVTRRLLESILGDEQRHANDLETVLAK
ncbi:MAG: ferritin-like domain-containing protein [Dehalococcoidia bacterium]|jgi:bacterioferritin